MEILSTPEMYQADRDAVQSGVASIDLMEAAGQAVVAAITTRWDPCDVVVLCGPGNNGGDGFVIARLLNALKWPVTVYLMGDKAALKGDALANSKRWRGKVHPLDAAFEQLVVDDRANAKPTLVIDAVFGAGLSKPLSGTVKSLAQLVNLSRETTPHVFVVAVDVPSGVDGDKAFALKGISFQADLTVTFCRPKPAHVALPARALCGEVLVADIGISDAVVRAIAPKICLNDDDVWSGVWPHLPAETNKYTRGHVVVLGGPVMSGAARLAALGARRMGAGLASIAVDDDAFCTYAAAVEPGTIVYPCNGLKGFRKMLCDPRKSCVVLGPGAGVSKSTRAKVLAALKAGKRCVLDADALSVFEDSPKTLFKALMGFADDVVITPHGGEFARLFPQLAKKQSSVGKIEIARAAAYQAGCVVLYKGADTTIAAPDGRVAVTTNAPPSLATAGAGDVLAGFIGALLAQNMPAFEAASAAAWLHGECANAFGPGLIAEDLIDELPDALDALFDRLD